MFEKKVKGRAGWVVLSLSLALLLIGCGDATVAPNVITTSAAQPVITTVNNVTTAAVAATTASVTTIAVATTNVSTQATTSATSTTAAVARATTASITTPAAATAPTVAQAVVQPKVIRTVRDSFRSAIQFTEQPVLKDGTASFIWFDAEG